MTRSSAWPRVASARASARVSSTTRVVRAVEFGATLGIKVNAGHGLHYTNVQQIAAIEGIVELNIGHAIVAHAIFAGWDNAVREMKAAGG